MKDPNLKQKKTKNQGENNLCFQEWEAWEAGG